MRKQAREEAFKLLYALEFNSNNPEIYIEEIKTKDFLSKDEKIFCINLILGVAEKKNILDKQLEHYTLKSNWPFDRLSSVDKNILRLALYEMLFVEDIPIKVSINEAVNIAKKYSDKDASKFINGVLGELVRQEKIGDKTI